MDNMQYENARLKAELQEMQAKRAQEQKDAESKIAKERALSKQYNEAMQQKTNELDSVRRRMVSLSRQLDDEVSRKNHAQAESQQLERKLQDMGEGLSSSSSPPSRNKAISFEREKARDDGAGDKRTTSLKLMRVIDGWMRSKDLTQALLRGAQINDAAFVTLNNVLIECPSLATIDLSDNQLTMDSCSDLCQLITNSQSLALLTLANNLMSLRSIGYFMTAVIERQNSKRLVSLDLLDLQGNEGLLAAASAPAPEALLRQVSTVLGTTKLPVRGAEVITQVMRALWRFLHDTGHPQVRSMAVDDVNFAIMDHNTVKKMELALAKILLLNVDDDSSSVGDASGNVRSVTADLVFLPLLEGNVTDEPKASTELKAEDERTASGAVTLPPIESRQPASQVDARRDKSWMESSQKASRAELRDPFADLKTAFEPAKERLKTFNLKQIVTRNGTVLMNMLERLLETTEIDARDVETEQTLLEYACQTGNIGLAKLCYRRGANLSARTKKGDTAFNIVTRHKRYDLMEFLHTYGVKVNSCDATGVTALHIAASNDDVDAICRLLEWGADVNLRCQKKRTPLHTAAAGGHMKATMLLLEVGADMNAKDAKEYTAVAHAEAHNHFGLMDRLVQLGGKGHGLSQQGSGELVKSKSMKGLGELNVSAQMLKSSSLGRIGKVKCHGLPDPMRPCRTK